MKSILVIDDDDSIAALLDVLLSKAGYRVLRARTGEDGLSMMRSHLPDLILLDIGLPGKDGISILKKMKTQEKFESLPVIMITADARRKTVTTAIYSGAIDYLVKPLDRQVLELKIRRAFQVQELELSKTLTRDAGKVVVERRKGYTLFVFSGLINQATEQSFFGILERGLERQIRTEVFAFDLRWQPVLNPDQVTIVHSILHNSSGNRPVLIAGRNYAAFLEAPLDLENQLFISEEDLERFLSHKDI
ncbi:MAG: response regulator [Spirochaetales bacterium]|nr:response regulator [Spirochaetales bacterium]